MKSYLKYIFLLAFVFVAFPVYAHPIDGSHLIIRTATDTKNNKLEDNQLLLDIFIPWQQLSYLHEQSGVKTRDASEDNSDDAFADHIQKLLAKPEPHREYIQKNITLQSGDKPCEITKISEASFNKEEVLVGNGVEINTTVTCPSPISEGYSIDVALFFTEFPYQIHNLEVYAYNKKTSQKEITAANHVFRYPEPTPTMIAEVKASETSRESEQQVNNASSITKLIWITLIGVGGAAIYSLSKKKKPHHRTTDHTHSS